MGGTFQVTMGDRGRLVVPAELRERLKLDVGVPLILVETPDGVVIMTRSQLRDRVRRDFDGLDLVTELLAERREAAAADVA